jgi:hypothetical protein
LDWAARAATVLGMQSLEGGATGPNGRDSRAVRPTEQQDPGELDQGSGRGSLMSRYRGAGQPVPGEAQATPPQPPRPRTGEGPVGGTPAAANPADSPWRQQSSWTSAPPVPPAPPAPVTDKPAPAAPAADTPAAAPAADKPAVDKPAVDKPAVDKPAADTPAADTPVAAETPARTEPPEAPASGSPAVTVTRGGAPGATATRGLLDTERAGEFRQRWRDLQADFVDDPQRAVRGAGDLSREILTALSDTIADAERVDRWKAEDGTSGTEDLRIALRQYRTLVDRLLEL